jgi:alpha-tubulin suppressor-like RCC1 family protein
VPAAAQTGVTAIAAGETTTVTGDSPIGFALALKTDGSVVAWGGNEHGQTDVPVEAQSGVVAIAAGFGHSVALKNHGSVLAWGLNNEGQTDVPARREGSGGDCGYPPGLKARLGSALGRHGP